MPAFDGTGPAGMGPMTGWGRGYCNLSGLANRPYGGLPAEYGARNYGYGVSSAFAPAARGGWFGRAFGFARGFGRGRGRGFGGRRGLRCL